MTATRRALDVRGACRAPAALQLLDELPDGPGRLVEGGLLLGAELDLEDPLHPAAAEDGGDAKFTNKVALLTKPKREKKEPPAGGGEDD